MSISLLATLACCVAMLFVDYCLSVCRGCEYVFMSQSTWSEFLEVFSNFLSYSSDKCFRLQLTANISRAMVRLFSSPCLNVCFVVTQANVPQAFIVGEAQIQQHLPMYQPLEDLVQRATFVNLAQHSHWVAEEERTILMTERLLALRALLDIFVPRIPLTSTPTPVPWVIFAQMGQSMQHNTHALKVTIMERQRV